MIRDMEHRDLDQIVDMGSTDEIFIAEDGASYFWKKEQLERFVEGKQDVLRVYEKEGEVLGFMICLYHPIAKKGEVENILVKKGHRKKGIAGELMKDLQEQMDLKGAEYYCAHVREMNKPAHNFFKKYGLAEDTYTWFDLTDYFADK